ncbi:MAG: hypothetical protein ACRDX8_05605 [Acidimicrobiales bacterium]
MITARESEQSTATLQAVIDAFLSSPRCANPNTRRAYAAVLDRVVAEVGGARLLGEV